MNQFLLVLQEETKNEFPLYQAKFIEMCNEGRSQEEVYEAQSESSVHELLEKRVNFGHENIGSHMDVPARGVGRTL